MNILFLSTENPYPPDHGHHIRTLYVLQHLAEHHHVHFVGFGKTENDSISTTQLENICASAKIFLPLYTKNIFCLFYILLKSVFKGLPFQVYRYLDKKAKRYITQQIEERGIDFVYFDMLHLAVYRKYIQHLPCYLTNHNVESLRLVRRADVEKNLLKKLAFKLQSILLARFEKKACPKFEKCIVVSEYDRKELLSLCKYDNFMVVPNGVDIDYFKPVNSNPKKRSLVWTGGMSGAYNRDAVEFFIKEIWPFLTKTIPDISVTFVGKNPPNILIERAKSDHRVQLAGYVDDVRPFMQRNNIFIAPLRSGSGTKIKVLNAMAMGMPVVTTSIGAEGIEAKAGVDIIIADEPLDFANQISILFKDKDLCKKLGQNARNTVKKKYDWPIILKNMDRLFELNIDHDRLDQ